MLMSHILRNQILMSQKNLTTDPPPFFKHIT